MNTQPFTLVLVRHGISTANVSGHMAGWTDVDLAPEGIQELNELKRNVSYPKAQRYYSSDLKRAHHTYDILFGDTTTLYEVRKDFREHNFGDMENEPHGQKASTFFNTWLTNTYQGFNEETCGQFQQRILQATKNLIQECQNDGLDSCCLVCHCGVIKSILFHFDHLDFTHWRELNAPNGLGFVLTLTLMNNELTLLDRKPIL